MTVPLISSDAEAEDNHSAGGAVGSTWPARPPRRRRSRRAALFALTLLVPLLAAFVALSCVLFVWPAANRPQHVGIVLSLNGSNENLREQRALALVREGYAPILLFSEGHYPQVPCPKVPHVLVVCFEPKPARTVGEVEFAAHYAERRPSSPTRSRWVSSSDAECCGAVKMASTSSASSSGSSSPRR